nr:MAG TPA: hypothetical protein [Caudoviricetes sp.]
MLSYSYLLLSKFLRISYIIFLFYQNVNSLF